MGIPKQLQSESVYAVFGIEGLDTFDFEQDIWCGRHAREDMEQYLTQSNKQLFFVGGVVGGKDVIAIRLLIFCQKIADLLLSTKPW